jgi:deoxyribodipyrimidine photo-lyase
MKKEQLNIVWFKRDLRLYDHEPLWFACRASELANKALKNAQNVENTEGVDLAQKASETGENAENTEGVATLLIYLFEPSVMNHYDADVRHFRFVYESLIDMNKRLITNNLQILMCHDEAENVFEKLIKKFDVQTVLATKKLALT